MSGLLQIRLCFSVLESQRANKGNLSSSASFSSRDMVGLWRAQREGA